MNIKNASLGLALVLVTGCGVGTAQDSTEGALPASQASDPTAVPTSNPSPVDGNATGCNTQQPNGYVGGASICCSGTYALCDGFENDAAGGNPNAKLWSVEKLLNSYGLDANDSLTSGAQDVRATVEVSKDIAARGAQSLHISAPNSGFHHDMIVNRSIFPMPNNTFWGRAFIYMKGKDAPNLASYVTASGPRAKGKSDDYTRVANAPNMCLDDSSNGDTATSKTKLPVNTWTCLEWQYKGDTNEAHLFVDGDDVADLKNTLPTYNAVRIGWEVYNVQFANPTAATFDMYFDEIAFDAQRIGCDK